MANKLTQQHHSVAGKNGFILHRTVFCNKQ